MTAKKTAGCRRRGLGRAPVYAGGRGTVCDYTETAEIAKLTKPGAEIPQTGDNSNFALWFASFAMSAAALIAAGVYSKRRRSSRAK